MYLFTERDSLVSIATLVKSKAFWKHVESCGVLITAIKDALQENGNKERIRTQVKALITQFISIPVSLNFTYFKNTIFVSGMEIYEPRHFGRDS